MGDVIRLTGLSFHAIVGDLPHEREHPQPVEVDVEVETDVGPAAASDSLADGLDYRAVYAAVSAETARDATGAPRLLETLAVRIADAVLALDRVESVLVRVRKPQAALPGPLDEVEVEVERP